MSQIIQKIQIPQIKQANNEYTLRVREMIKGEGRKYFIRTFGCQQNEADSELLSGVSTSLGFIKTETPEDADLILVNTCAVREHAELRALSVIGQYKHLKEKNPRLIIGVGGCMTAEVHRREKIKHSYPYVSFTFGAAQANELSRLIYSALAGKKREFMGEPDSCDITEGIPVERTDKFRAWVSIMYGCNNFCSYCIVPYVRGRERSRKPEAVESEVSLLVAAGVKEITLLGQNVNSYGKGTDTDVAALFERLCKIDGDFKLRFMTSHPKDVSDRLIETIAANEKLARHFHLPVQSGSNRLLELMNRRYTAEKYLATLQKLRTVVPGIAVTSDIIVGFPGETDDDFERTLELIKTARYDMLYSFIYSPRVGTPAASMPEQISDEIKSERFQRLLEVQNAISLEINRRDVGSTLTVLCEGASKNDPLTLSGRSDKNKIVHFKGNYFDGDTVKVKITEADTFMLFGNPV